MSTCIVPTDPAPFIRSPLISPRADVYYVNGESVAIVFPGESHQDAWQAAKQTAGMA